jgi:hypothetical protein
VEWLGMGCVAGGMVGWWGWGGGGGRGWCVDGEGTGNYQALIEAVRCSSASNGLGALKAATGGPMIQWALAQPTES